MVQKQSKYPGKKVGKLKILRVVQSVGNKLLLEAICDCGRKKIVSNTNLHSIRSCGCLIRRYPGKDYAVGRYFISYKRFADYRDIPFRLPLSHFAKMVKQECYYCGALPSRSIWMGSRYATKTLMNGIDRRNNAVGYSKKNVVTACRRCNIAKNKVSAEEFIEMARMIYWNRCV